MQQGVYAKNKFHETTISDKSEIRGNKECKFESFIKSKDISVFFVFNAYWFILMKSEKLLSIPCKAIQL